MTLSSDKEKALKLEWKEAQRSDLGPVKQTGRVGTDKKAMTLTDLLIFADDEYACCEIDLS